MPKSKTITLKTLLAGEPHIHNANNLSVRLFGEDLVHDRMLVSLVDWADWVEKGWRTKVDVSDEDLKKLQKAITIYLDQLEDNLTP